MGKFRKKVYGVFCPRPAHIKQIIAMAGYYACGAFIYVSGQLLEWILMDFHQFVIELSTYNNGGVLSFHFLFKNVSQNFVI